ncbi:MAG: hypothetical protein NTW18_05425 [Candidatus Omnitrophica bacterium]|nr:hypothetical protein [Candidatus Omnitrophota bacterium]
MKKFTIMALMVMCLFLGVAWLYAQEKTNSEVIAIATEAVKANNFDVKDVDVIYDEGGKLWNERAGYLVGEDQSPNHGIMRRGFLKNYKIVLFDYKEPLPDIWVFIDKDTNEVLEVYQEKTKS